MRELAVAKQGRASRTEVLPQDPGALRVRVSSRVQGVRAPSIRTSVSPDLILRRRTEKRRKEARARSSNRMCESHSNDEIIIIPSDSEADARTSNAQNQPSCGPAGLSQGRGALGDTRVTTARAYASAPSNRRPDDKSNNKYRTPPWLRVGLSDVRKSFPNARFALLKPLEMDHSTGMSHSPTEARWTLVCQECEPGMPIEVGPGTSLGGLIAHLENRHFPTPRIEAENVFSVDKRSQGSTSGSSQGTKVSGLHRGLKTSDNPTHDPRPGSKADPSDEVEEFLRRQGLSTTFANTLRSIGISDAQRMRSLSRLPGYKLDKLEIHLADLGVDFVARMLIREGLHDYAGLHGISNQDSAKNG
ncbi:hypothetical protein C8Q79DRAFT_939039 [Trametes meyenii]|nr:hypothetical protein C8Q79DRAFT_939039 [Trametes meyenii]